MKLSTHSYNCQMKTLMQLKCFHAWNGVVALLAPTKDQMSIERYLPQVIKKAQNISFLQED